MDHSNLVTSDELSLKIINNVRLSKPVIPDACALLKTAGTIVSDSGGKKKFYYAVIKQTIGVSLSLLVSEKDKG